MKEFKPSRNIIDADDYIDYANDIWESYLETFTKDNGLIRDITEDDCISEDWSFLYTNRGQYLAEKMRDKLIEVGQAHFPDDDIDLFTSYYLEQ